MAVETPVFGPGPHGTVVETIGERIVLKQTQPFKNKVLAALPKSELSRLLPKLSPVNLPQGKALLEGESPYAYFLEDGMASVVVSVANGDTVEVGLIGFEGVVGIPILLGTGSTPGSTFMQIGGYGHRIEAQFLAQEFEKPGELRRYLQKYIQGFMAYTAQTAVCNRLHNIEERLARWLLSCRDRIDSDVLRLTHEFLGQMLGSPRTTVTLAAGLLQRAGMIHYSRGTVTIRNRVALEKTACECYKIVRNEFQRMGLL